MRLGKAKKITILCFLIFFSQMAMGQLGRIRIMVVDSKAKPIENVKITLLNDKAFDFKKEIFTDEAGTAGCIGLSPDVYLVVLEKEGYFTQKRNIKISATLIQEQITFLTEEEVSKEAQAKDPSFQAINKYNESIAYTEAKEYDKALSLLEEAVVLDGAFYQSYFEMGKIYHLKNMFKEALAPLHKCISLKADYAPAYRFLAASYEM